MKCLAEVVQEYNEAAARRVQQQEALFQPPIVVSRQAGSGGYRVAKAVAARLGFQLWDRQLLEEMAAKGRITLTTASEFDERHPGVFHRIGLQLFNMQASVDEIDAHLRRTIATLVEAGGVVLVGRGAAYMCRPHEALRLRIVAPLETRVANWMRENEMGPEATRSELLYIESQRAAFLKRVYHKSEATAEHFDLMLNTAELSVSGCVELALAAYDLLFSQQRRHRPAQLQKLKV